jgi:hypothetical protein
MITETKFLPRVPRDKGKDFSNVNVDKARNLDIPKDNKEEKSFPCLKLVWHEEGDKESVGTASDPSEQV